MMGRLKRVAVACLMAGVMVACAGCGEKKTVPDPSASRMKAICQLSVMDCYYHNVAKFWQEDAEGSLWWKKDKHFWIEYDGTVTLGIDVSRVNISMNGEEIDITLPPAEVQKCSVNEESLNPDAFIVAKDSAKITAEDEVVAFQEAQADMEAAAKSDRALLAQAQQRAQQLLEDYVRNFESLTGKSYRINWHYLEDEPVEEQESESETEA